MTTSASASNRLSLQKPSPYSSKGESAPFGGDDDDTTKLISAQLAGGPRPPTKQELSAMDTVRKKANKEPPRIRTPPPPAVARRNARERNRVKQVNNGFANLRQRIPNSIAATFESGRNKKLSKVETLRMAVEYIRSLEEMLNASGDSGTAGTKSSREGELLPPPLNFQSGTGGYVTATSSSSSDDDNISSTSTPPPLRYIHVGPSSATYDVVHVLEDEERLKVLPAVQTLAGAEMYSDSSYSPAAADGDHHLQRFIPVFEMDELTSSPVPTGAGDEDKVGKEGSKSAATEEMRILCRNLIMLQADNDGDLSKQLNMNELMSW